MTPPRWCDIRPGDAIIINNGSRAIMFIAVSENTHLRLFTVMTLWGGSNTFYKFSLTTIQLNDPVKRILWRA